MARSRIKKPRPPPPPGQKHSIITRDQVFDADFARKYNVTFKPVLFKNRPVTLNMLTRSATLALSDYNNQKGTDYQFVNVEMATWHSVGGSLFHITFIARNAENKNEIEYSTFQATVYHSPTMRMVRYFRKMEKEEGGSGRIEWCDGSLSEVVGVGEREDCI